jgi:hypothetical protein
MTSQDGLTAGMEGWRCTRCARRPGLGSASRLLTALGPVKFGARRERV